VGHDHRWPIGAEFSITETHLSRGVSAERPTNERATGADATGGGPSSPIICKVPSNRFREMATSDRRVVLAGLFLPASATNRRDGFWRIGSIRMSRIIGSAEDNPANV
jgi:hypothetical protein